MMSCLQQQKERNNMEHVEAILYHKILDSDFTNMYEVKKYHGGNGQTYIQAAGFSREELDRFFQHADTITPTLENWDSTNYPRNKYIISAQEVGTNATANIEFSPRTGRKDYRIARQNLRNRHPAWSHASGFPEPLIDSDTQLYIHEKNYPGIIDNLYILIISTINSSGEHHYYASYVDSNVLPDTWPSDVNLDTIFKGQSNRQGILFFDKQYIRFKNNKILPFLPGSAIDTIFDENDLPDNIENTSLDAVEFLDKDIDLTIDISSVNFVIVDPPQVSRRKNAKRTTGSKITKGKNYLQRYKNNKAIGEKGEVLVLELERRRLIDEGRPDLAASIIHSSKDFGDGLGYDIESYHIFNGVYEKIYIEVKSTTGGIGKPFDISSNETEASEEFGDHYYIYRLFGLHKDSTQINYYTIAGSIRQNFDLTPTSYLAVPK